MLRIRSPQDVGAAAVFMAFGLAGAYFGNDLRFGSAGNMGPGYFPTWLGAIMIGFGVVIGALSFKLESEAGQGLALHEWGLRPWLVLPVTLAL